MKAGRPHLVRLSRQAFSRHLSVLENVGVGEVGWHGTSKGMARAPGPSRGVPRVRPETEGAGRTAQAGAAKVHVGFRLAADVVEGIEATGKGYNSRVERVLRDALAQGKL